MKVREHIDMLGLKVRDRVTGREGIVSSMTFDLYGCIQAIVNPGLDKEGKQIDLVWFDVSRLEIVSPEPVMERPNFDFGPVAEGRQGASEKPAPRG